MFILYFLLIFLIVLITFIIISTLIKFSLFCTTKYKYNYGILIVPSILTLINLFTVFFIWYLLMNKLTETDLFQLIFNMIIKIGNVPGNIFGLLLMTIGFLVVGVILESLVFLTVNIDYTKLSGKIRMLFNSKSSPKESVINEDIIEIKKPKRLSFLNALASSIFLFSIVFFSTIALFSLGKLLGAKILK